MNLQFVVSTIDPLLERLQAAGVAQFLPVETRTYMANGVGLRQRQFVVQDPDGYLLRFAERAKG